MNDISDEGVSALCKTFYVENTLKVLFLVLNPINRREIILSYPNGNNKKPHFGGNFTFLV